MVEGDCVDKEHVFKWTLTQLRPKNNGKVKGMMYNFDEEIEINIGGEWIAKNLFPNDNVVVPTLGDEPFTLMLVDKGIHVVVTSVMDGVGNEWMEGNVVVCKFWYERLNARSHSYTFCDDKLVAFLFSHLILASIFFVPPITHVVEGNYATYELINVVL
jgi:hypothetical protein